MEGSAKSNGKKALTKREKPKQRVETINLSCSQRGDGVAYRREVKCRVKTKNCLLALLFNDRNNARAFEGSLKCKISAGR